jgi:nicotinate-nucleotide adenylyltransferase
MPRSQRVKIGILGGTFNPVHLGHLLIAQDALEAARLSSVRFIPSATPPHKQVHRLAPAAQRLAMLKLALRGNDRFAVDDREIRRGGKSYSVDTILELKREEPQADFSFIIGADSLEQLHTWREIDTLVGLCSFIAVTRPGFDGAGAAGANLSPASRAMLRLRFLQGHASDIASRDIRARVARGQSVRYLVPDAVFRYIQRHRLYH